MQGTPKVEYLLCQKGGYHYGQSLNMVCLEPTCQDKILCCCACIQETHKQHNTKPLRLLLLEASKSALSIVPSEFNIDIALELINSNLKQSIQSFNKFKKNIVTKMQAIQNSIISYYSFLIEQVKLKNIDPKFEVEKALQSIQNNAPDQKEYIYCVKRIAGILSVKKQEKTLTQADILSSLNFATEQLKKGLETQLEEITNKTNGCLSNLNSLSVNASLWKESSFKFSTTNKHQDIKIINEQTVKASNASSYKFALMEPGLEKGEQVKDFAFKIKESTSNWVAVGMCHKNIVASKHYGFNFNTLGHGAYMVSANGGSWSNIKADQNNSIKAFKFTKGDIICIRANFKDKTITFKRNNDKYVLNFQTIAGDELCPCVLFYYVNDEVQFLPNHKF